MPLEITPQAGYFAPEACVVDDLAKLTSQTLTPDQVPHAQQVEQNIPLYDMAQLEEAVQSPALKSEWAWALAEGPGVVVLRNGFADTTVLDQATDQYEAIIAEEKEAGGGGGDHFAKAGANDRVWNSLQKLCLRAPGVFARYFSNVAIAAISEAWLGPNYQMTAQVNLVRPGGAAQQAHRDYHLGFLTTAEAAQFPAHVHDLSPTLTLQGAVAHTDMPIDSGPTKLLPFSQRYRPGYVAFARPDFRAFFEEHHVQLPLRKGDLLFFNPAVFHAAGENRTRDVMRLANLLQVGSAFGRSIEAIDRRAMCQALYPVLRDTAQNAAEQAALIGATAEGYAFPTNLDTDPPQGGLAPESQAALLRRALRDRWADADFNTALDALAHRQRA